ncbi:unnamed protein product [Arctia plantaginis]|uniref:Uncharacterized protein n=1 Tax=Arctia plantaginis TaxID=874455 RepID=A0A8S1B4H8_ARCPL|nr:unnamed protein product [Arctia plantaginis]
MLDWNLVLIAILADEEEKPEARKALKETIPSFDSVSLKLPDVASASLRYIFFRGMPRCTLTLLTWHAVPIVGAGP